LDWIFGPDSMGFASRVPLHDGQLVLMTKQREKARKATLVFRRLFG
jgi:hypothetical protein